MRSIYPQPNDERTGFKTYSDYTKAQLAEWLKKYKRFEIMPVVSDSDKGRRYLEGAIVTEYCAWQYGINPREKGMGDVRRTLFKRDFHYSIIRNRDGKPARIPLSTLCKVNQITEKYTTWATENGAPVPNPELFKLYRDKYSMDYRWDCFHDWLAFLELEIDAMPRAEVLEMLN